MNVEQLITTFDVVSFIVGIVSIVLAVVSLVLSILFYRWGIEASKSSTQLTTEIEAHTKYLKDLFDQMLKTTFEMIRDHNQAMDRKFLDAPGKIEANGQSNLDIDLYSELLNKGQVNVNELADKYHVDAKKIKDVAKEISKRGSLSLSVEDEKISVVSRCFVSFSSLGLADSGNELNVKQSK